MIFENLEQICCWKYSPLQKIFKMSSVNNIVNGNESDNGNDNDIIIAIVNDVFAVSNFSDPFCSAFKKLTQL